MTNKLMPSIIQIEEESLMHLVTEVKETIAIDISLNAIEAKGKKFSVTDMWNSQRNFRTADSRRRYYPKSF